MTKISEFAATQTVSLREALQRLNSGGVGILLMVDAAGLFYRTVTDGDIRRLLLNGATLDDTLSRLTSIESIVLREGYTRKNALELMNEHSINHLPVLNTTGQVIRLLERKEIDEQILLSTPHLGEFEREFVEEAFRTNWIAPLGPNVDAFERELAESVGVRHAAALSSGTAAIHLALRVLEVGPGDTVFCSALTFVASAAPIVYQGAEPVFIDSEPESWNMSAVALEEAFADAVLCDKLPRAVIIVNLYGQSADFDPLLRICRKYDVPVVEDAAESLGAKYNGRASGSFGLLGVYSFNGNKIITTSGGGMLVSENQKLIHRARFLATQARDPALHYEHTTIGYNYRMSNILAGVGRGQLKVLSERVAGRRRIFERYRQGLGDIRAFRWMPEPEWSCSNRWLSVCTLDAEHTSLTSRDVILQLGDQLIEARPVWKPMQMQPVFSRCKFFAHQGISVAQTLFEQGMCLPSGTNMSDSQQDRIVECLRRVLTDQSVS